MGYLNIKKVFNLSETGILNKTRGGKSTTNPFVLSVLLYMATSSYDFPPTGSILSKNLPCRYYARGWRSIAAGLGMVKVSRHFRTDGVDVAELIQSRERTAQNRISTAWKFLQEQGLIKCLQPASLGKNAGFLLLLGDELENYKVEEWARACLNLEPLTVDTANGSSKPLQPVKSNFIGSKPSGFAGTWAREPQDPLESA